MNVRNAWETIPIFTIIQNTIRTPVYIQAFIQEHLLLHFRADRGPELLGPLMTSLRDYRASNIDSEEIQIILNFTIQLDLAIQRFQLNFLQGIRLY
jgi:hypothetical protein